MAESEGKIIKKTKLGKKRFLKQPEKASGEIKEEIIVVGNNINKNQKENSASFLIKLIIKSFYLSIWKKKIKALKYYSKKTNKQRMNFKKLIYEISLVIEQHKSDYVNEIFEKIDKFSIPKNYKHDQNFGTIKIVKKKERIVENKNNNYNNSKADSKINKNKNYINDINDNQQENIEDKNYINAINYKDNNKEMYYNMNNFNENNYYNYPENKDIYNPSKNKEQNHKGNYENQNYYDTNIEEDEYFIENEYDGKEDILNANDNKYYNTNNINYDENQYQENYDQNNYYCNEPNYDYNYQYENNYNDNEDYYQGNNLSYNDYPNNNINEQDIYYQNQYDYYPKEPNEQIPYNEEEDEKIYYQTMNKVDCIKSVGNHIIINDVFIKPKIEKNENQYYYNKNNYQYNIDSNNYNNQLYSQRAFPSCTNNHSLYISK